jgi:hypothetical protein
VKAQFEAEPWYINVQGFQTSNIAGFDGIDLESRSADQVLQLAFELTDAARSLNYP